jgi:predicted dehydrogenase
MTTSNGGGQMAGSSSEPVRAVVLGAGGFGREVIPALRRNAVQIVGLVDPDRAQLSRAIDDFGLGGDTPRLPDGDEWGDLETDLVVDCSPPAHHLRHARRAFANGRDLLMSKPMSLAIDEAETIVSMAAHGGRHVGVMFQMRYLRAFQMLRALVCGGELGRLGLITATFNVDGTFWEPGMRWRLTMPHPVLYEGSVHVLDLVRWVTGAEPAQVTAHSYNPPWSSFTGSAGLTVLTDLYDGTVVRYLANWAPRGSAVVPLDSGWELEFEHGLVRVNNGGVTVNGDIRLAAGTNASSLVDLNTELIRWYLGCREGRGDAGPTGADSLRTMRYLELVRQSADDGRRVRT